MAVWVFKWNYETKYGVEHYIFFVKAETRGEAWLKLAKFFVEEEKRSKVIDDYGQEFDYEPWGACDFDPNDFKLIGTVENLANEVAGVFIAREEVE